MQSSSRNDRQLEIGLDAGLSMIATVLSLVATALLVALLLGDSLHSGSAAKPSAARGGSITMGTDPRTASAGWYGEQEAAPHGTEHKPVWRAARPRQ